MTFAPAEAAAAAAFPAPASRLAAITASGPRSPGPESRAAAEIACRLHLLPAAAARNSHGTLQPIGLKVS